MALGLKPLPNPTSSGIADIVLNLRTAWENFKKIITAFEPMYYTSNYPSLAAMVTEIGTASATIYVNSAVTLTANLTIPSTISTIPLEGGSIAIANGVTLTMPIPNADRFQWITWTGTGTVQFTRGKGTVVKPEWFGATSGTSNSQGPDVTAGLQRAILVARNSQSGNEGARLSFGPGTYWISASLTITGNGAPISWIGDFKYATFIKALASSTIAGGMVELTNATTEPDSTTFKGYAARSVIDGVSLDGGGVYTGTPARAEWGYKCTSDHITLKSLRVKGTGTAAIDFGGCNNINFLDLETSGNLGDGIRLNRYGSNNAVSLVHVASFSNGGWGLRVRESVGLYVGSTCTIELNDLGGIFLEANVHAFHIDTNYFESNGATGHTFTSPATLNIKCDILINGSTDTVTISNGVPCTGLITASTVNYGGATHHIYCPGQNGLIVQGCRRGTDTGTLVGTYGSPSAVSPAFAYSSVNNIRIEQNTGWGTTASPTFAMSPLSYFILQATPTNAFISDAQNRNIAQTDMSKWTLLSAVGGGTWARSATTFPDDVRADVWELALATVNASDVYGFSIAAANLVNLHNKLLLYSVWMLHTELTDVSGAIRNSSTSSWGVKNVEMDYYTASAIGWRRVTMIMKVPTTGDLTFEVQKIVQNAGKAGTVYIANPVVCEYGSNFTHLEGNRYTRTDSPPFTGILSAVDVAATGDVKANTVGKGFYIKEGANATMGTATLVAGSVVVSTTKVTATSRIQLTGNADGGTPGWLRVSARTPGTSFTITSSAGADTGAVAWVLVEPA